jgi:YHS domain-containing protein/thiol-disulfide isomerase/thioredoxin
MRCILPAIGLCLAWCAVGSAPAAEPPRLVWHTDFQKAQKESATSGLPLLVHFYGTNCPPCRQMEAEVFRSPEFQKAMAGGFVLVKLESRKDRALLERFEIRSVPADLVLSPTNEVLWMHEGYQSGDRRRYVAAVSAHRGQPRVRDIAEQAPNPRRTAPDTSEPAPRFESQPAKRRTDSPVAQRALDPVMEEPAPTSRSQTTARAEPARRKQPSSRTQPSSPAELSPQEEFSPQAKFSQSRGDNAELALDDERLTATNTQPKAQRRDANRAAPHDGEQADRKAARPVARTDWALDGYSPVSLKEAGKWVAGQDEFTAEHDGLTYRFTNATERDRFLEAPDQFAVQEGGRDVVLWDEVHKQLQGSTRFAAYYNGQLYLFYSRESRGQFKKNPARYARGRQAAWQVHPSDWGVRLLE